MRVRVQRAEEIRGAMSNAPRPCLKPKNTQRVMKAKSPSGKEGFAIREEENEERHQIT